MATELEKHSSFPGAIDADELVVEAEAAVSEGETVAVRARGYWEGVWLRLRRDKLALAGAGFIVFLVLVAFAGAPIAAHFIGHGPNDPFFSNGGVDANLQPATIGAHVSVFTPSGKTEKQILLLGGDSTLGRDEFLRVLYGAQVSLEVGVGATILSMALGLLLGSIAGFFRGWLDTLISRLAEVTMALPYLLVVIALAAVVGTRMDNITLGFLGHGVITLVVVFGVFSWFYPARVFRGLTFSLREKEFVEAARMIGASEWRIIRSHILPHLVGPIIVLSTLNVAQFILAEAGLSFLGLGIKLPTASWGNLLSDAQQFLTTRPELVAWPGIALILTTLAFNLLGDGLRDAFDPRGGGR
jgi:ABC-type dipeptide/oligopeptide/nickel transport system permease subunit